ncbi:DUF5343 domain-containing protein [Treponema denticola]|uniref:DUF5343 domain-containing protein n=1 Tax=Treponema denticola TaxID=158 RepID=UPI0021F850C1|nr:DUF5343 domain-containing protein [Treponema denticola]UYT09005.1 DUF5343 domain-containing protein [Treponema denticola]
MALANVALQVYGQIGDLLDKIKKGQAPSKFTNQHLKDIGFASSNHRAFIPLLKALSFLNDDGSPTERYKEYRNEALSKKILGEAVKEAYSDIFVISKKPSESDRTLIEGKFKSVHNTTDRSAELMAKTFFALLEYADIDSNENPKEKKTIIDSYKKEDKPTIDAKKSISTSLNYNIQIHLPATKDIEVYNAIFKSLKEHLIE